MPIGPAEMVQSTHSLIVTARVKTPIASATPSSYGQSGLCRLKAGKADTLLLRFFRRAHSLLSDQFLCNLARLRLPIVILLRLWVPYPLAGHGHQFLCRTAF
jgi:hypothetical protein